MHVESLKGYIGVAKFKANPNAKCPQFDFTNYPPYVVLISNNLNWDFTIRGLSHRVDGDLACGSEYDYETTIGGISEV